MLEEAVVYLGALAISVIAALFAGAAFGYTAGIKSLLKDMKEQTLISEVNPKPIDKAKKRKR
jgi:hypothetical protein